MIDEKDLQDIGMIGREKGCNLCDGTEVLVINRIVTRIKKNPPFYEDIHFKMCHRCVNRKFILGL